MFPDTKIPKETIQAYLETEYLVFDDASTMLKVGHANHKLAALHQTYNVECSAFITACNPYSETRGAESNTARLEALAVDLKRLGLVAIGGIGKHPSNNWPGEASLLVPGLSLGAAKALGVQYGQNAIVWSAEDATPQLILLR